MCIRDRYAYNAFKTEFDREHGGFGYAPKFPMPVNLLFLLRYYRHKMCIRDRDFGV